MLEAARIEVDLASESLRLGFLERPFQKEAMTDVLSQWTFKQQSFQPLCISHNIAISKATVSAQPMSRPLRFQPSKRRQDAQLLPTHRPRPQEVEVSTQMSRSFSGSLTRDCVGFKITKVEAHHDRRRRQAIGM